MEFFAKNSRWLPIREMERQPVRKLRACTQLTVNTRSHQVTLHEHYDQIKYIQNKCRCMILLNIFQVDCSDYYNNYIYYH